MTECYWLALARDVPYTRHGEEPVTAAAVADLRRLEGYRDVDARTLFRSDLPGVMAGPTSPSSSCSPTPSAAPLSSSATAPPCRPGTTQSGVVTFGAPHVLDLVARVANHAMKAAWYHKWLVHRRFRPEEAAGRIHNHLTGAADYPLHPKLTDSAALCSPARQLPVPPGLPRGLPRPPRLPRCHGHHGGAGVSVLKAFFNEAWVIPNRWCRATTGCPCNPEG